MNTPCEKKVRLPKRNVPLILGAGGFNIFFHMGVLKAAAELGIDFGSVLGVSCGALAGAFLTNGYTPDEMITIFLAQLGARYEPTTFLEAIRLSDPLSLSIGGIFSLEPALRRLIRQYKLKPNDRLNILACDILRHEPVLFKGTDYDLGHALTSSGSIPRVFQPQWDFGNGQPRLLVDGAVYHFNPTEFTRGASIVSRFRNATKPPREGLPIDYWTYWLFEMSERIVPLIGNRRFVDPCQHLVIENGFDDVPGLNFGITAETCLKMVRTGYKTAMKAFKEAKAEGRLP